MSSPTAHHHFTVTSQCLCYGALHNIKHGASQPPIQGLPSPSPQLSGTVSQQPLDFNIPAKNGLWGSFQLIDLRTSRVSAWFACHSHVDPVAEADRILRVSGSPYEDVDGDNDTRFNSEKTAAQGVLVINRYDWDWCDDRDIESEIEYPDIELEDLSSLGTSVGIVDYASANAQLAHWREQGTAELTPSTTGIWMDIPQSEYAFGRFGFDEARQLARSFLFFTADTYFPKTTFRGLEEPLRREETGEERFYRRLREGYDYEGIDRLHRIVKDPFDQDARSKLPSQSECVGPFDAGDYLLDIAGLDALCDEIGERGLVDPLKAATHTLLNEMVMSYLVSSIAPSTCSDTVPATAASLYPRYSTENTVDFYLYRRLTKPHDDPIEITGLDTATLEAQIKRLLIPICSNSSLIANNDYITGLGQVVIWVLQEVLELTNNRAYDFDRPVIVPLDVRSAVGYDEELQSIFRSCSLLWYGRD
ncbi:hypothetical protein ASPWEDRAFT_643575 [Aspergillus wentii DTO 134E9]|uniref:Uncharacterized protein n=1 Tax=Aspergillus wentii DTO 134E9 TaxID=1073089 RepID=A0A1L9RAL8_ASPWE|nr:uncharacterized protein ASPWEDRAFT_643575 [Aspergillus wentii DTO 134E9]KAI9934546.1 hypothetical protein MW887_000160 [Aspergillus wentii]OJJ31961.1 hypothetical protein ASPWEDRAFT_643575 [Aspergillus wentii DTO 134E9]